MFIQDLNVKNALPDIIAAVDVLQTPIISMAISIRHISTVVSFRGSVSSVRL
jgi:hypothetical protein